MKALFFVGFGGLLSSLVFGMITGEYLMAILMSLTSIGILMFSAMFLIFPIPVQLVDPLQLNMNMTVTHKCGDEKNKSDDDDSPPHNPDWGDVPGKPFEGG